MNHAAATVLPAMFLVYVVVAIAITPSAPRHRRGSATQPPKDRP